MKKTTLLFLMILFSCGVNAQDTTGLVAHWNMNGTTNDLSGHGHNGNGLNITAAAGMDGIMGHAWYFNGSTSKITIPYATGLNVTNYSICAIVKADGFNSSACHANDIFIRGDASTGNGTYELFFTDQSAGISCTAPYDSTQDCFVARATGTGVPLIPSSITAYNYTPHIVSNVWYKVVATFNDTVYKFYVNDTLINTVYTANPGVAMGASADSASIGYNTYDAGFNYQFKGAIDDIMLYNRVLSDSEITLYGADTCGTITSSPATVFVAVGSTATYSVATTITSATYQWQMDAGTGYVNLTNAGAYSGVYTAALTISGATAAMAGDLYRCIVGNSSGCNDTSTAALMTTGIDQINVSGLISVYPNPSSGNFTIETTRTALLHATYQVYNDLGQLIKQGTLSSPKTVCQLDNVAPGVYYIKLVTTEGVGYKRIIKN